MNNNYSLSYSKNSQKQQKKLKSMPDVKQSIERIASNIVSNPYYNGNGVETLGTISSELISRRVNKKDRFVYIVNEESKSILVINILGHFTDSHYEDTEATKSRQLQD